MKKLVRMAVGATSIAMLIGSPLAVSASADTAVPQSPCENSSSGFRTLLDSDPVTGDKTWQITGTYVNKCGGQTSVKMKVRQGTDSGCVSVASGSKRTINLTRHATFTVDPNYDGFALC